MATTGEARKQSSTARTRESEVVFRSYEEWESEFLPDEAKERSRRERQGEMVGSEIADYSLDVVADALRRASK